MENIFGYFRILFLLCCLFWISSNAERKTISKVVGSTVNLYCKNDSLSTVGQVIWTKNKTKLLSWVPSTTHWYPEAYSLHINISVSQDNRHTLTIERLQEAHAGNYTCETTTLSGLWEAKWMLIITEDVHKEDGENKPPVILIGICVSAVLAVVVFLTILQRHCKGQRGNNLPPATRQMVNTLYPFQTLKRTEEVYENCLERQYCRSQHIYSN